MERRELILLFISDYKAKCSYAPTVREIGESVDLKSTSTVHGHLTRLMRDGLITYTKSSPRTLKLTQKGEIEVDRLKGRSSNLYLEEIIEEHKCNLNAPIANESYKNLYESLVNSLIELEEEK